MKPKTTTLALVTVVIPSKKLILVSLITLFLWANLTKELVWAMTVDISGRYAPPAPTIVSPKGETFYGTKITFTWLAARKDIPGYRICIGSHPQLDVCSVVKDIHLSGLEGQRLWGEVSIPVGGLRRGERTKFYWKMASLGGEAFDWSRVASFYVDLSSPLPICEHSRPHGEKIISSPEEMIVFAWEEVPGAEVYALKIYKGSPSASVYKEDITFHRTSYYGFKAKDFSFNERYSWEVKALRADRPIWLWSRCCGGEFKLVRAEIRGAHRYRTVRLRLELREQRKPGDLSGRVLFQITQPAPGSGRIILGIRAAGRRQNPSGIITWKIRI